MIKFILLFIFAAFNCVTSADDTSFLLATTQPSSPILCANECSALSNAIKNCSIPHFPTSQLEFTQLANIAANCTCTQVNSLGNTCNTCLTTQNLTTVSSSNLLFNLIGNCNTSATAIPKTVKLFETIWGINATTNFNKQTVEKVSTTSANPPAETAQIVKPSSAAYKSISVTFTFLMSALIFTL